MNHADAEEYTQALGQVVAGGWRQVALGKRLGVPQALGISTEEWVEGRLGGYVRLSIPERREAVAELVEEGMSTREIGDVLGVDHSTVVRDAKADGANAPEPEPEPPAEAGRDETDGAFAPEPEPAMEPDGVVESDTAVEPVAPPPVDELADNDARLRRSRARKMLAKAASATSELSSSVDQIAEAVVAQHPDQLASERARIERNRGVWDRLLQSIERRAAPELRRVK